MQFKQILIGLVAGGLIAIAGLFAGLHYAPQTPVASTQSFGAFTPVESIPFSVAKTVLPADNTITLSSFTTPDGRNLTMSNFGYIGYGTLDPNNLTRLESITFSGITNNANGTVTLTGVTRGNDFVSPYAASSTLAQTHLVGSSFILSNTAGFYGNEFLFANNAGTSSSILVFSSTTPPRLDAPGAQSTGTYIATTSEFATIAYVNSAFLSGAANATNAVKGIVQLATAAQAALGTIFGSTGASLVLPSSMATSTPYNGGSNVVPVTGTNEKLSQSFLDLTQAFTTTGQWTFNTLAPLFSVGFVSQGSSTLVGNTNLNQPGQIFVSATTTTSFPLPMVVASSSSKVSTGSSLLASSTIGFIGFSLSNATNGSNLFVQTSGIVSGFSGLTIGIDYYLQDAGGIGVTPGTLEMYVGTAISATQLVMEYPHTHQYVGTASFSGSSAAATFVVPAYVREIEINMTSDNGVGIPISAMTFNLSSIGHTSGTLITSTVTGGASQENGKATCAISGGIGTCSLSAALNGGSYSFNDVAGTAYFYR